MTIQDPVYDPMIRVQETLLAAVDREVSAVRQELNDREADLKASEAGRKDMAVEAYKYQSAVDRLNGTLASLKQKLERAGSDLKTSESERNAVDRESRKTYDNNRLLHQEMSMAHKSLAEMTAKIDRLGQINNAYNIDLKIQKRINSKTKKDHELMEEKKLNVEAEMEAMAKKMEKLVSENKDLQNLLNRQNHANIIAQGAISKMMQEINEITELKRTVEKQWEEALTAMTKRDATLKTIEMASTVTRNKLLELEDATRLLKQQKRELEAALQAKEADTTALQTALSTLRNNYSTLDAKHRQTKDSLVESQVAESIYKQEFESTSKKHGLAKDEIDRKTQEVGNLKNKVDQLKEHFDNSLKNELIVEAARREERVRAQAAKELNAAARDHESRNVDLRQENVRLHNRLNETEKKLLDVSAERNSLEGRYKQVNGHYVKMYNEAKYLVHALERKEHDINQYKSKIVDLKELDNTKPIQIAMGKLQKELRDSLAENDKLQSLWVESRKNALKLQENINKLTEDNSFLSTQLGINETIKVKTNQETESSKKEALEQRMETSRMYIEIKKLQPLVDELKQKNLILENQLADDRRKQEEKQIDSDTCVAMLKAEIRRLYEDRKDLRSKRCADEKSAQATERKYVLNKEMFGKINAEKQAIQKENFALRMRGDAYQKKYAELKLQYKAFADLSSRNMIANVGKRKGDGDGHPPSTGSGASLRAQSAGSKSGRKGQEAEYQVPDIEGMKLCIDRMSHERAHRISEIQLMRRKLDELSSRISQLERQVSEAGQKNTHLERQNQLLQSSTSTLTAQCQRAEKLAAHIEQQYKEAKPNTKVDYDFPPEIEPSTHLVAALTQKDATETYRKNAMHMLLQPKSETRLLPIIT